jgi:hypothetical protein
MYKVVHISSGIVAITFNDRQFALDWIADNNILYDNEVLLYKLVKTKDILC